MPAITVSGGTDHSDKPVTEVVGKPSHVTRTQYNDGHIKEIWTAGKVQDGHFVKYLWIFFKNGITSMIEEIVDDGAIAANFSNTNKQRLL